MFLAIKKLKVSLDKQQKVCYNDYRKKEREVVKMGTIFGIGIGIIGFLICKGLLYLACCILGTNKKKNKKKS